MTALIDGLTASSRASAANAASLAETFFDFCRVASSAAERRQRFCMANSLGSARVVAPPPRRRHTGKRRGRRKNSADSGQEISQVGNLIGGDRLQHFRHDAVIAVTA